MGAGHQHESKQLYPNPQAPRFQFLQEIVAGKCTAHVEILAGDR